MKCRGFHKMWTCPYSIADRFIFLCVGVIFICSLFFRFHACMLMDFFITCHCLSVRRVV